MSVVISSVREVDPAASRKILFPAIQWGAIVAGVVVGLAVQLVMALLGLASGLTAIDFSEAGAGIANVGRWAAAWQGISMLIAAFTGGYVAARMSGLLRTSDGMMHGFVAWGATTLLFAVLSMSAVGGLFGSVFYNAGNVATSVMGQQAGGGQTSSISSLIGRVGGSIGAEDIATEDMGELQSLIAAGDREQAIAKLTEVTELSRSQAAATVDQALILSGSPDRASPEARAAADKTVESMSMASWGAFAAVILSLTLGVGGGALGAIGSRRTRHEPAHEPGHVVPTLDKPIHKQPL